MKKLSKVLIVTMALAMVMAFMPATTFAASTAPISKTVTFTAVYGSGFDVLNKSLTVSSDTAEKYYSVGEPLGAVTYLDVLVAAHIEKYGEAFKSDPTKYLTVSGSGNSAYVTSQFGHNAWSVGYINNKGIVGVASTQNLVAANDNLVTCTFNTTDTQYAEKYTFFSSKSYKTTAGSKLNVTLKSKSYDSNGQEVDGVPTVVCTIQNVNTGTYALSGSLGKTEISTGSTNISFSKPGTYYISAVGSTENTIFAPLAKVNVGLNAPKAKLSKKKATSVKVSWGKVTGASKYKVYRATKKSGKYKLVKSTSKTSFTNTKLKRGGHYYYKVKAVRGSYTSSYSKIIKK